MPWLILINNQNENDCIWAQRQTLSMNKDDEYICVYIYIIKIFKCITFITHNLISFSHIAMKIDRMQKLVTNPPS